ncbi:hypothetical protein ACN24K_15115 [Streptomyces microflavus]
MITNRDANHVLALQVGESADSPPEIHTDMAVEECIEIVAKADEATAAKMRTTEARFAEIEKLVGDPDKVVEFYELQAAGARRDEVLTRKLQNIPHEEQQKLVDAWHLVGDVGSMICYHGYSWSGRGVFFTGTWPNFNWFPYDCNDAASSVKAWGPNVLCEHSWYRGRRFYAIGTYQEFRDLRDFGFDNLASSYAPVA